MKRILMIDDEQDIADIVQYIINQQKGMELIVANNAKDGLRMAQTQKPNLLLLDIMLPDQMGDEILAQIKSLSGLEDIPVIFMTGLMSKTERSGTKSQTILANGQRYLALSKPFTQDELIIGINKLLGMKYEQ